MTLDAVTRLVQTLLYEGYLLYPYRRSSGKNRHHWMFGTLYPRSFAEGQGEADPWWTRTECLAHGDDATVLSLHLRFLHLAEAGAIERQVDPSPRRLGQLSRTQETVGFDVASADGARAIRGALHLSAERLHESLFKIAVRVENVTGFELGSADDPGQRRDAALRETPCRRWRSASASASVRASSARARGSPSAIACFSSSVRVRTRSVSISSISVASKKSPGLSDATCG